MFDVLMAMPNPTVTICVPSYNRADLVEETLQSILAQTFAAWEAIVVDDGSTDNSLSIISRYAQQDSRIRLMSRTRSPKGACTCRNIAVENARGRYVIFLDTDDILAPFCLEQRVRALDEMPEVDFAIFPMLVFADSTENANRFWNVDSGEDDLVRLLRLNPVCQGTGTLWRRESFIRVGMWNEKLFLWQDIDLHLRAFTLPNRYVKRFDLPPDVFLRETSQSLSRGDYQSREKLESRAIVAREAVRLLTQTGRTQYLSDAKFLVASVVSGATRSGNFELAAKTRKWAIKEGVLSSMEGRRLFFAQLVRVFKIDRLPVIAKLRNNLLKCFNSPQTIGSIKAAALNP